MEAVSSEVTLKIFWGDLYGVHQGLYVAVQSPARFSLS
ncbi:hypothetical protein C900_02830 [Fulvivirga imtechensis AK7]|uniref:Uncharacterized protein n=1 Tax=Fulvivirga imtechensis AK7 TaxID=1237149 RepID=L8JVW7_9BACT|nr:hypothetical protein C900_02830 [Fulvivirga imtechensis AK7]